MKSGSMASYRTAGEPPDRDECEHGVPGDQNCWECKYEDLAADYKRVLQEGRQDILELVDVLSAIEGAFKRADPLKALLELQSTISRTIEDYER